MKKYLVTITEEVEVTIEDNFDFTYEDNDGTRQSRGSEQSIVEDLALRLPKRPLSMLDGYADLDDSMADARVTDEFADRIYVKEADGSWSYVGGN